MSWNMVGRVAMVAVAPLLLTGCPWSEAETAAREAPAALREVGPVAERLPGVTPEQADEAAQALRAANGGSDALPPQVAEDLTEGRGVVGDVLQGPEVNMTNACAAYDKGEKTMTVLDVVDPAARADAQEVLTQMWDAVTYGSMDPESIAGACKIHEVLEQAGN